MTKIVSLVDMLQWTDGDRSFQELDAKGKTFDVPQDEADRLVAADAAAKPGTDEAKDAKASDSEAG